MAVAAASSCTIMMLVLNSPDSWMKPSLLSALGAAQQMKTSIVEIVTAMENVIMILGCSQDCLCASSMPS